LTFTRRPSQQAYKGFLFLSQTQAYKGSATKGNAPAVMKKRKEAKEW
jgi:hypothetical protein